MTKKEFENLAGYQVTAEDYCDIIEPMYESTELTKEEFIKAVNKDFFKISDQAIRTAKLVEELQKIRTDENKELKKEKIVKAIGLILHKTPYIIRDENGYPKEIGFMEIEQKLHLIPQGE